MPASSINAKRDSWGMDLAFWATLLVAGALFMAASLAPRLATLADQHEEYAANQRQLVELERRADDLERITRALQQDSTFATELACVDLAHDRPGSQRISVPADLQLGAHAIAAEPLPPGPSSRLTLAASAIRPLADQARLRFSALVLASTLVVVAFALLNEALAATIRAVAGQALAFGRSVIARYRRFDAN